MKIAIFCHFLLGLEILISQVYHNILCWIYPKFLPFLPIHVLFSTRMKRRRRNLKSPVLSPWCRTATASVSPSAHGVNCPTAAAALWYQPHHWQVGTETFCWLLLCLVPRTRAEVRRVHGGEVAPDSGLCPGGDWQRELFHHEVQGWDNGTSGPAEQGHWSATLSRHNQRLLYFSAGGHEWGALAGLQQAGPGVTERHPDPGDFLGSAQSEDFPPICPAPFLGRREWELGAPLCKILVFAISYFRTWWTLRSSGAVSSPAWSRRTICPSWSCQKLKQERLVALYQVHISFACLDLFHHIVLDWLDWQYCSVAMLRHWSAAMLLKYYFFLAREEKKKTFLTKLWL